MALATQHRCFLRQGGKSPSSLPHAVRVRSQRHSAVADTNEREQKRQGNLVEMRFRKETHERQKIYIDDFFHHRCSGVPYQDCRTV